MINGGGGGGGGGAGIGEILVPPGISTVTVTKAITTATSTLNVNSAFTITGMQAGWVLNFVIIQDATGGRTLTINGASVTLNLASAAMTMIKVLFDGTNYYVISENTGVQSVNGKTGATVTLAASDVGALTNLTDLHTLSIGNPASGAVSLNNNQITNAPNGAASGNVLAFGQAPITQATTGLAGTALINGTQTLATYTTPNDGNLHSVYANLIVAVSVATTGGACSFVATNPNGGPAINAQMVSGTQSVGSKVPTIFTFCVGPGAVCSITQAQAMTAGTAQAYANIDGH